MDRDRQGQISPFLCQLQMDLRVNSIMDQPGPNDQPKDRCREGEKTIAVLCLP